MCAAVAYGTKINQLSNLLEELANDTIKVLNSISYEMAQNRIMSLQNPMALDYLLASQGGIYALTGRESCAYIDDEFQTQQKGLNSIEREVKEWKRQKESSSSWWSWLTSWLPNQT
uniref:Uncharacterized protein n=1 Tax=Falco tinnunculus TaxID=100819 RepID=A0A8C4XL12_FALTI